MKGSGFRSVASSSTAPKFFWQQHTGRSKKLIALYSQIVAIRALPGLGALSVKKRLESPGIGECQDQNASVSNERGAIQRTTPRAEYFDSSRILAVDRRPVHHRPDPRSLVDS